eukprot:4285649-Prymnesium_polylepis.1
MRRLGVSCPDVVVEEVAQRDEEHHPKRRAHIEPHTIVGGEPAQPTGGERARDFAMCQPEVTIHLTVMVYHPLPEHVCAATARRTCLCFSQLTHVKNTQMSKSPCQLHPTCPGSPGDG